MHIFGHCKFLPVFLYQKGFNKFGMHTFGHSEFIPVFLGKIARKNLEWPFLAIPNLYQSFWEKLPENIWNSHFGHSKFIQSFWEILSEKIWKNHFWPFQIYTIFLGKIVGKNLEWSFLAILNLYQSFWEKLSEKIQNSYFWPF